MSNDNRPIGDPTNPSSTLRAIWLCLLLAASWLLWSGLYKPLLLGLGALSCVLTLYLAKRMRLFDQELFALWFSFRLLTYWWWLAKQIVRSSVEVARIVLDPRLPVSPTVIKFKCQATHPADQAILGNSITLTPGTIALDVHQGLVIVHALTQSGADEIASGEMDRRVAQLRGR